jgi:hypothetical protein
MTHRPCCALHQNSLQGARHHQASASVFFVVFYSLVIFFFPSSVLFPFYLPHLFGAFTKLRKATLSFVLSVRPHGTTRFQMD